MGIDKQRPERFKFIWLLRHAALTNIFAATTQPSTGSKSNENAENHGSQLSIVKFIGTGILSGVLKYTSREHNLESSMTRGVRGRQDRHTLLLLARLAVHEGVGVLRHHVGVLGNHVGVRGPWGVLIHPVGEGRHLHVWPKTSHRHLLLLLALLLRLSILNPLQPHPKKG